MPKEFGGRKAGIHNEGRVDEDEENKLEELKVIIVVEGDAECIKKSRTAVAVTKTVVGAIPSRPKPTTRVLDRRSVFGSTCQYRLSSAAAVQQCSR